MCAALVRIGGQSAVLGRHALEEAGRLLCGPTGHYVRAQARKVNCRREYRRPLDRRGGIWETNPTTVMLQAETL